MSETVGFIGLGHMGAPMARNLLAAGYGLRVWNRTAEKADELAAGGARRGGRPADTADPGGIVVSMVADDAALLAVTVGPGGLLETLGEGGVHVSMSTVAPATVRELAVRHEAQGARLVAAPVFGRPDAAAAGKLFICAAGDSGARSRVAPVLAALGQKTFDFGGDPAAAAVVKLAGNFLIASAIEAMGEAFAFAEKWGVAREAASELYASTLFSCPIYKNYGAAIAAHRYSPPGFALPLGLKDVTLAREAARSAGVPMPLASLLQDRFLASMSRGRGGLDWAALALEASEAAGLGPAT